MMYLGNSRRTKGKRNEQHSIKVRQNEQYTGGARDVTLIRVGYAVMGIVFFFDTLNYMHDS
jgi:hypothetical protein